MCNVHTTKRTIYYNDVVRYLLTDVLEWPFCVTLSPLLAGGACVTHRLEAESVALIGRRGVCHSQVGGGVSGFDWQAGRVSLTGWRRSQWL